MYGNDHETLPGELWEEPTRSESKSSFLPKLAVLLLGVGLGIGATLLLTNKEQAKLLANSTFTKIKEKRSINGNTL